MKLNILGSIFVFLVSSYPGLIISILVFCVSIILLIIKRKTLKNGIKIILIILVILSALFICLSIYLSIAFGRHHSIAIIGSSDGPTAIFINESNKNNGMELFYNDYEIINYNEHQIETIENTLPNSPITNTIQMNFTLRIINLEKVNILKNIIEPIIYVHINNKKYLAKGQLSILSSFPDLCDLMFPLDSNGKIYFIEDRIIPFLGFEKR